MKTPALAIIEEVYQMALNPTQPYAIQLDALSASGELGNKAQTNEILFRLCELVDKQQAEIQVLQDDRVEIANKMLELQKKAFPIISVSPDPTQPLDVIPSTQTTEPNA